MHPFTFFYATTCYSVLFFSLPFLCVVLLSLQKKENVGKNQPSIYMHLKDKAKQKREKNSAFYISSSKEAHFTGNQSNLSTGILLVYVLYELLAASIKASFQHNILCIRVTSFF